MSYEFTSTPQQVLTSVKTALTTTVLKAIFYT